jgi:hypothetical protein
LYSGSFDAAKIREGWRRRWGEGFEGELMFLLG